MSRAAVFLNRLVPHLDVSVQGSRDRLAIAPGHCAHRAPVPPEHPLDLPLSCVPLVNRHVGPGAEQPVIRRVEAQDRAIVRDEGLFELPRSHVIHPNRPVRPPRDQLGGHSLALLVVDLREQKRAHPHSRLGLGQELPFNLHRLHVPNPDRAVVDRREHVGPRDHNPSHSVPEQVRGRACCDDLVSCVNVLGHLLPLRHGAEHVRVVGQAVRVGPRGDIPHVDAVLAPHHELRRAYRDRMRPVLVALEHLQALLRVKVPHPHSLVVRCRAKDPLGLVHSDTVDPVRMPLKRAHRLPRLAIPNRHLLVGSSAEKVIPHELENEDGHLHAQLLDNVSVACQHRLSGGKVVGDEAPARKLRERNHTHVLRLALPPARRGRRARVEVHELCVLLTLAPGRHAPPHQVLQLLVLGCPALYLPGAAHRAPPVHRVRQDQRRLGCPAPQACACRPALPPWIQHRDRILQRAAQVEILLRRLLLVAVEAPDPARLLPVISVELTSFRLARLRVRHLGPETTVAPLLWLGRRVGLCWAALLLRLDHLPPDAPGALLLGNGRHNLGPDLLELVKRVAGRLGRQRREEGGRLPPPQRERPEEPRAPCAQQGALGSAPPRRKLQREPRAEARRLPACRVRRAG
mmetsp:Transcript_66085/g.162671  ORF Transcript_66085/g.162671 Transcript_66085/m.162671 type:complete len:631 (-) Transcript_66085:393-2285(-)